MKKRVIKDEVVIRSDKAERDGKRNEKGVIFKGFEIEVIETLTGEEIDDNNVWYKDRNGDFYWSGGFEKPGIKLSELNLDHRLLPESICAKNKLIDHYENIKPIISNLELDDFFGEGINIAVLDSGVFESHPDLKNCSNSQLLESQNFHPSYHSPDDLNGHGTHIAGLISGNPDNGIGVKGVAPLAKIWNLRVADERGDINSASLIKALDYILASDLKIDVINLSLNTHPNYLDRLNQTLSKLFDKGIIIVGAANDAKEQLIDFCFTPAASPYVISVGAFKNDFSLNMGEALHETLDYIMPLTSYCSTSIEQSDFYKPDKGSSMNVALFSGIVARLLSKSKMNAVEVIQSIDGISHSFSNNLPLTKSMIIKNENSTFRSTISNNI